MHRIDGAGATVDNKFTEGNPATAVPATTVTDDWLNDVQEEILSPILAAGITPEKGNGAQLLQALGLLNGRVVSSIAQLKALDKTKSPRAFVLGYYADGDGGGGAYWYDSTDTTSADNGGSIIVATDGGRWKLANTTGRISVKQFGAKGDGVTDDTAPIQAALTYCNSVTDAALTTSGALTSAYAGTTPRLRFPRSRYKVTGPLAAGSYLDIDGDASVIVQATAGQDILAGTVYLWQVRGLTFVGGRHHVNIGNDNIDSTVIDFERCEFHLSSDYAVKTAATGGVYSHMSANLTFRKCRFLKCKRVLDNCCDSAVLDDCWVRLDKSNFDASTAAFRNKGDSGHPRLFFRNMFGVPSMGIEGVDRVANARWIDNYGSVYATGSRFGGEDAGLSILWHLKAPSTTYPYIGTEVVFNGCWLYGGPDSRSDSGAVILNGEVPNLISIKDCQGPAAAPFVVNPGGTSVNFSTYFTNWEAASGKKAYNHFQVAISGNDAGLPDGIVYGVRIPAGMRPYVTGPGTRQTRVRRAAAQSIPNGFASTHVSFDTVEFDNIGGFDAASPTRLVMPPGCTRMRIAASIQMAVDGAAKTLAATIITSGSTRIAGDTSLRGVNADSDRLCIIADVEGAPGSYWHINIQHNAAAALNLLDCRVSLTPLDFVR